MRKFIFTNVWLNKSGSVSALVQQQEENPLALSTGKSSVSRSAVHTFTVEKAEQYLGVTAEQLAGTDAQNGMEIEVNAEDCFGIKLQIQVLEAAGTEAALALNIINRNKDGVIMGLDSAVKKTKDSEGNLVEVKHNGKLVYRKTRLIGFDPDAKDVRVDTTAAAPVAKLPETEAAEETAAPVAPAPKAKKTAPVDPEQIF
jgi:hypothetical protein